jgi:hypothetical protein
MNTAAVSIELYLKSLSAQRIYTANNDMSDASVVSAYPEKACHSLEELFDTIREDLRDKLTEKYDSELRIKLNDDVMTALNKIEGAFMISRYPFEPGTRLDNYPLSQLVSIAEFLHDFVKALPPKQFVEYHSAEK